MAATVAFAHTGEKHRPQGRVLVLARAAIGLPGGIEALVKRGETVLIKPNLTVCYSAGDGFPTDPLAAGAPILLAKEAGTGRVRARKS